MNVETLLQRLASRARMSDAPRVHVADRVMAQLAASGRLDPANVADAGDRTLAWGVAACVTVAVLTAVVAYGFWQGWQDPVVATLTDFAWGLPI